MTDTYVWPISIITGKTIININETESEWFSGPFKVGDLAQLASVVIENESDTSGAFYFKGYIHPNNVDGTEAVIYQTVNPVPIDAYGSATNNLFKNIVASDIVPGSPTTMFGVKAWSTNETEPSWGSLGTFMSKKVQLNGGTNWIAVATVAGIIGIPILLALKK